jgi:hypothetical protein
MLNALDMFLRGAIAMFLSWGHCDAFFVGPLL